MIPTHPVARRVFLKQTASAAAGLSLLGALPGDRLLAAGPDRFLAGAAKKKIAPPLSIPYLTSSANGTCKEFEGTHDDLFARALVLDDGRKALALVAVDSIGYDNLVLGKGRDFTQELRKRISRETRLDPQDIMLTATHAHSTPETIGLTNFREIPGVSEWIERHLVELADTVIAAWKQRVPVRTRFGKVSVDGIARNRRILLKNKTLSRYGALPSPEQVAIPGALDEDLSILHFETALGETQAVLLNYTAHPVVTMLLPKISADYPGSATAHVEQKFPGAVCLFTQGAAGNINSIHVTSRYEDAETLGEKLGQAAASKIAELKTQPALAKATLQSKSSHISLEPRSCPALSEAQKLVSSDASPQNQRLLRLARKLADGPLRAEIQAMQIGPVSWLSLPGEPFVETGLSLKQAGASFVCGYSNGWLGYFPVQRAYDEGGYEVDLGTWSRVAPGSAEVLEAKAEELLKRLLL